MPTTTTPAMRGSNEYPYTSWETAADSIQKAVNAAVARDTVFIDAGHWYEYIDLSDSDTIAVIGMGIDSTFCHYDSVNAWIFYDVTNGCLIKDITFSGAIGSCVYGRLNAGFTVSNCKFRKSGGGICGSGYPEVKVLECIFDSCNTAIAGYIWIGNFLISNNLVLYCQDSPAIMLRVNSAIVQNNIIIHNLSHFSTFGGPHIDSMVVRNNVVVGGYHAFGSNAEMKYNNIAKDVRGIGDIPYGIDVIDSAFNNILLNCRRGVLVGTGDSYTINYNAFWRNGIDIYTFGGEFDSVGNIFCNPMLVSEDDFHLQAYSPLIDAGHPDYLDVDGTRSDIGAYGGPFGCSYTYLDLAPQIPDSITVDLDSNIVILDWPMNTEADFNRYQIFRDTVEGFEPTIFDIIAEPDTSYYIDSDIMQGIPYYYRLTSVDNQGNVSDYSDEVAVIPTYIPGFVDDGLPKYAVIESAYPNPANSQVTIVYSASNLGPQPPLIELKIFDIQGRVVKTLVDGRKPFGTHRVVWDGTNDSNQPVASGNYIAKIFQWYQDAGDFPVKITLIK